tara:strand:- start:94 stop:678 length:585 start_codon:yes stop_codon:yes gene_type:complete
MEQGGENMTGSEGIKSVETQLATLGGGCFWCLEAVFDDLVGVEKVESGYMGGDVADPSYEDVCSGGTGHAEVVQITFDESVVSYKDILEIFFTIHDPTTLNRQGNDVGPQYRTAIFYHDAEQHQAAGDTIRNISRIGVWSDPLVTEITEASVFYKAEAYHQNYFKNNPVQPYCQFVVAPKVAKFRKQYVSRLKE